MSGHGRAEGREWGAAEAGSREAAPGGVRQRTVSRTSGDSKRHYSIMYGVRHLTALEMSVLYFFRTRGKSYKVVGHLRHSGDVGQQTTAVMRNAAESAALNVEGYLKPEAPSAMSWCSR